MFVKLQWTMSGKKTILRPFVSFCLTYIHSPWAVLDSVIYLLKYGFCNKSFRKDEPLTSWTLFSTYLLSKLDSPSPMFWLEENLLLSNVLIRGESNFDDKYVEKSVQLVRGSSFWNDLLQNPYFNNKFSVF